LIPNRETGGFIQDENGSYVKSRLDQKNLELIAKTSAGLYVPLGNRGEGLETIYRDKLALVPQIELAEKRKQVPIERFSWPIGLAIFLLACELMISGRKNGRPPGNSISRLYTKFNFSKRTGVLALIISTALTSVPMDLYSSEAENQYANGNYIEAGEYYQRLLEKQPDNPLIIYNSGTTAYKNNLFEEAVQAFDRSLASDDLGLQEKSYFNRGNALYRQGESSLQSQPEQSVANWERAVSSYEFALSLNPDNEQARANHAFVSEKLEQFKNDQQQNQEQNQEQNSQSQQNEKQQKQQDREKQQPEDQSSESKHSQQDKDKDEGAEQESKPSAPEKPDEGNQDGQPQQADANENQNDADSQEPNASHPAAAHEMSKEEAEQLLQALKGEEGRLDFYAPSSGKNMPNRQDW